MTCKSKKSAKVEDRRKPAQAKEGRPACSTPAVDLKGMSACFCISCQDARSKELAGAATLCQDIRSWLEGRGITTSNVLSNVVMPYVLNGRLVQQVL